MNQQERYELLTKLSEFYVKEVKYNLECFNKAKFISKASHIAFWLLALSMALFLPMILIVGLFASFMKARVFELYYLFLPFVVFIICFCSMKVLEKMDKENKFQVFKGNGNTIALPLSADNEIKKRLMSKFVALFGDFTWRPYYTSSKFAKKVLSIEGLNILKNPLKLFDDYIEGVYKGVKLIMFDGDTSIFKLEFVALFLFLLIMFGTFLPIIGAVFLLIVAVIFLFKYITSKQFKGLVVEIDMNKDFEGHTFILEKNNVKDNLTVDKGKYQEVNLEDVEFSNEYNVYSQNQIEARYILTTAFMDRIKNIKETFNAKYVRVSFKDKKIVILIHTGRDMFNLANFLSDIGEKTFVQCFEEVCSVLDLVEELKLNEKLGL
ncbi:DUF3137 domain-containing protein [bacterium]|nr:DUF3137 domain-containing protein [bacterium]